MRSPGSHGRQAAPALAIALASSLASALGVLGGVAVLAGCNDQTMRPGVYGTNVVSRGRASDAAAPAPDARSDPSGQDGGPEGPQDALDDGGAPTDGGASDVEEQGCPAPASSNCPAPAPSFTNDVFPLIMSRCSGCHDPAVADGPWPFTGWDDVAAWGGLINQDLLACTMPPPDSGTRLSNAERFTILAWIACGIPNN